jgi:hypothetical protein
MSKIVIVRPGVIRAYSKKKLEKAGYVIIEATNPTEIRVIEEYGELSRDLLLQTAIEALSWGNDTTARNAFGNLLRKKLEDQWKKPDK